MTTILARHLEDYLAMRRSLGFKLRHYDHWLWQFVAYLDWAGATSITIEAVLAWAAQPAGASPRWIASRMSMARGFSRHMASIDPATEVPPTELTRLPSSRAIPFIYSSDDIRALMTAARTSTKVPLIAATRCTLIGLLTVTGMFSGGRPTWSV